MGIDFIGMNGGSNEAGTLHGMTQTLTQQQQQQVDSDLTAASFPQHLGQLPGGSVDQLAVRFFDLLIKWYILCVKLLAYNYIE